MRILYIHQYFCTRQGRSGTRSYEFARHLVRRGHRVTMLTSASALSDITIPKGRRVHRFEVDGIDVIAVRVGYSQNMGPLRRMWSFAQFMLLSSWYACRARGHDVVLATSTPLTVGIPGVLAKWALRIPFVFEVRDLWPEAPIQMGVIRNPLLIRMLRGLERFLYRRAAHVIALSPGMRDGVVAAGTPESQVTVIPNCSDLDLFQPGEPSQALIERYDLDGRFVVLHAGSMGASNGLEVVIDAAARMQREGQDHVRFVLLGDGSDREALRVRIRQLDLENVILPGSLPRNEVADFVRAADVCLVVFRNVPILATNSPNKMFDALAGGRPVIVNSDGWTRELIETHEAGRFATPGSGEALAEQIAWLASHPAARRHMGENARRLAESVFERGALAARFEEVLLRATGASEGAVPGASSPASTFRDASTSGSARRPGARAQRLRAESSADADAASDATEAVSTNAKGAE